jgi:hypothetical protein
MLFVFWIACSIVLASVFSVVKTIDRRYHPAE